MRHNWVSHATYAYVVLQNARVANYLSESTRRSSIGTVETQLIKNHVEGLLGTGFHQLLSEDRKEDLARLYFLMSRVDALSEMQTAFQEHTKVRMPAVVVVPCVAAKSFSNDV